MRQVANVRVCKRVGVRAGYVYKSLPLASTGPHLLQGKLQVRVHQRRVVVPQEVKVNAVPAKQLHCVLKPQRVNQLTHRGYREAAGGDTLKVSPRHLNSKQHAERSTQRWHTAQATKQTTCAGTGNGKRTHTQYRGEGGRVARPTSASPTCSTTSAERGRTATRHEPRSTARLWVASYATSDASSGDTSRVPPAPADAATAASVAVDAKDTKGCDTVGRGGSKGE
jgi:hypothetical protein